MMPPSTEAADSRPPGSNHRPASAVAGWPDSNAPVPLPHTEWGLSPLRPTGDCPHCGMRGLSPLLGVRATSGTSPRDRYGGQSRSWHAARSVCGVSPGRPDGGTGWRPEASVPAAVGYPFVHGHCRRDAGPRHRRHQRHLHRRRSRHSQAAPLPRARAARADHAPTSRNSASRTSDCRRRSCSTTASGRTCSTRSPRSGRSPRT